MASRKLTTQTPQPAEEQAAKKQVTPQPLSEAATHTVPGAKVKPEPNSPFQSMLTEKVQKQDPAVLKNKVPDREVINQMKQGATPKQEQSAGKKVTGEPNSPFQSVLLEPKVRPSQAELKNKVPDREVIEQMKQGDIGKNQKVAAAPVPSKEMEKVEQKEAVRKKPKHHMPDISTSKNYMITNFYHNYKMAVRAVDRKHQQQSIVQGQTTPSVDKKVGGSTSATIAQAVDNGKGGATQSSAVKAKGEQPLKDVKEEKKAEAPKVAAVPAEGVAKKGQSAAVFTMKQLPAAQIDKLGLTPGDIARPGVIDNLLRGQKTEPVQSVVKGPDGKLVSVPVRLQLEQKPNGSVGLKVFPEGQRQKQAVDNKQDQRQQAAPTLAIPGKIGNYTVTDTMKKELNKNNKVAVQVDPNTLKPTLMLHLNRLLGKLTLVKPEVKVKELVKIPGQIKGVKLDDEQRKNLRQGKPINLTGLTDKNGMKFDATVQVNAQKRSLQFTDAVPSTAVKQTVAAKNKESVNVSKGTPSEGTKAAKQEVKTQQAPTIEKVQRSKGMKL